jgi:hypothetical protein
MMLVNGLGIRIPSGRSMRSLVMGTLLLSGLSGAPTAISSASDVPVALFAEPSPQSENSNAPEPVRAATAIPLPTEKQDLQLQKEYRFRELKRQMEMLDRLVQPGPAQLNSQQRSEPETQPDQPVPAPESGRMVPDPSPMMNPPRDLLQNSSGRPLTPHTIPSSPRPEARIETEQSSDSQMIVEGTIDRFALATSLFGTGQVETCLDVLRHTDIKSLPREDQIWAYYMQACCHRKCGRIDEARQGYRRILAEKDADWVGELASWWLDNIDSRKQLQSDVERLKQTLTAWEEEIDNLAKQTTATGTDK